VMIVAIAAIMSDVTDEARAADVDAAAEAHPSSCDADPRAATEVAARYVPTTEVTVSRLGVATGRDHRTDDERDKSVAHAVTDCTACAPRAIGHHAASRASLARECERAVAAAPRTLDPCTRSAAAIVQASYRSAEMHAFSSNALVSHVGAALPCAQLEGRTWRSFLFS